MKKKLILTTILSVLLICCFSMGGFAMEVFSVDESQYGIDSSVELSSVQPLTQDRTAYFSRNYTLTNDPGTNMARIAQAQVGKNYANLGYSEAWCANFVADCARLAGQTAAVPAHAYCPTFGSLIKGAGGTIVVGTNQITTPKAGDIIFYGYKDYPALVGSEWHVGLVTSCSNGIIYTVEGNMNGSGNNMYDGKVVASRASWTSFSYYYIIRPNYKGTHTHSYTLKNYEAAHPHKEYTYCSCGKINPSPYTGNVYFNANCSSCKAIGAPKGVSVSVTGNSVTVKWNKTSYTHHYDVYLVQSPYRWEDIKYKGKSTGNSYTFSNVKNGDYRAFVIARPNKDQTQSSWVNVKVPNNPVSIKIYFENNDKKQSIGTTNAVLSKIIKLDGADISKVTKVGISLYDAHGNLLKTKSETPIASGSYIEAWYNINEELGYILTPGTTYQYQFSATVNGVSFSSNREFFTTLSPTPTPTPTPVPSVKFTDVKSDAYYATPVAWAVAMEVTSGTSATTFSPDNACTRGQAVTFLWRAAGKPAPKSSYNPFTDVKAGQYYYDAVLWAVEQGITKGTSTTTFSPDATCNRGQIVTFLYRAEGSPNVAVRSTFGDVATDAYYAKAVTWAVDNGVTSGTSATTFSPDNDCTRGQIVTFLYRAEN